MNLSSILLLTFALKILVAFFNLQLMVQMNQSKATTSTIVQLLQPKLFSKIIVQTDDLCVKYLCLCSLHHLVGEIDLRIPSLLVVATLQP